MRKAMLSTAISEQRQSLLGRVASLEDQAWSVVCPNPAAPQGVTRLDEPTRTVRDLVAHVCVVDGLALDANLVRPWDALRRLQMPSGWDRRRMAPFLELSPTELVTVLARSGERLGRMVSAAPSGWGRLPVAGPFGRQPLAQLVTRRVLHEWLHERDIADGLAAEAPHSVQCPPLAVAEAMVDAVLAMLPDQVLPRASVEGGVVRLVIDYTTDTDGAAPARRVWAADFTRRQYGPRVIADPDTTVRLDAPTLALLANGRSERVGADSLLVIDGDQSLGDALLRAIRCPTPGVSSPDDATAEADLPRESASQAASLY